MKRVITYDFLRGMAIIGVILFHVLNFVFSKRVDEIKAAMGGEGSVEFYWYIIGPILLILGSFNGLFLMISAASNAISVHKQWVRFVVEREVDKSVAYKKIMLSQVIRGSLIWIFGYVSETIFGGLMGNMLKSLIGETPRDFSVLLLHGFFLGNILYTIAYSIIITSFIQLYYLKSGMSRKKISVILISIALIVIALEPISQLILKSTFGTDTFSNDIETAPFGEQLIKLILVPFVGRLTPLVPFFSCAAFGLLISININDNNVKPSLLRKSLYTGLMFVVSSIILGAIFGFEFGDRERYIFYHVFILGLEIMSLTFLLYIIDFRKKTRIDIFIKATTWVRRFGVMTLTLWMLQYFMVFPIMLMEIITGWPMIGLKPGVEGGNLVDWQLGIVMLLLFFMWHFILKAWQKVNFKGSFEWLTASVMSGRTSSGDRARMNAVLNAPEKMIEHVAEGRLIDKKERALIITNIIVGGFDMLAVILLVAGIL
ncbi:MAG: hypothetical protein ACTSYS_01455 [Promethearchaeota archaeon]